MSAKNVSEAYTRTSPSSTPVTQGRSLWIPPRSRSADFLRPDASSARLI